jgi:hypothetical protein
MGQSTFPVPSSGSSTSTILPVNASSVILDGSLTSASTYTTTVNGNGGIAYLVATDNLAIFTIGGNNYTVNPNSVAATTTVVGSSASVTIKGIGTPPNATNGTFNTPIPYTYGVAFNGTRFAMIPNSDTAGTSNTFAYSTNGTSWTSATSPYFGYWYGINYVNTYFVALGNSTQLTYSSNGSTWTAMTLPNASGIWQRAAYCSGASAYIAVQQFTGGARSTSFPTWTAQTFPITAYYVAANSTYFVISNNTNGFAYSTNGTTWTTFTGPTTSIHEMVYVNGVFITLPSGDATGGISTNGTSWSSFTLPSSQNWTGIAFGSNYYFATASSSTSCAYSLNGTTWTAMTVTTGFGNGTGGIAYGLGYFIVPQNSSNTTVGYASISTSANLPVNFGIYNGPTTIN